MTFGSVCSGIEAASVAFEPLGWRCAWTAEIEAFPSAVLAHRFPSVPNLGDMTTLPGRIRAGEVEAPDLLVGGTPCQSFSVAGLRKSMEDPRGQLTVAFLSTAEAIDAVRLSRGQRGAMLLWENVPGVLSTKDNAFGCFLAGVVGCESPIVPERGWTDAGVVSGPRRLAAWRVLDAQFFGLAQRRRRVFVVAGPRDGPSPITVLFVPHSLSGDPPPSREAGKGTSASVAPSLTGSGRGVERTGESRGQDPVVAVGGGVAHSLRAEGFDASEDGTGRGTPLVPDVVGALTDGAHGGGASTDRTPTPAGSSPFPLTGGGRNLKVPQRGRDGAAGLRDGDADPGRGLL